MFKIKELLYNLGCECTYETENTLHMNTRSGVKFVVSKVENGYKFWEDGLKPKQFRFEYFCHEDPSIKVLLELFQLAKEHKDKYDQQPFIHSIQGEINMLNNPVLASAKPFR